MKYSEMLFPFLLSLAAGLSTGIGGLLALFAKKTSKRFLPFSLGFAAGVMVMVSLADLLPEAAKLIGGVRVKSAAGLYALAAMLFGMFLASVLEKMVPNETIWQKDSIITANTKKPSIMRLGIVTTLAIVLHNLPEGVATFMAGYKEPSLGFSIALAIALHNIPEGISVAVPVYFGTGSKGKAVRYAILSGLSEPLGALLAMLLLRTFLTDFTLGMIFGITSGIMLYISFDELIPAALGYGSDKIPLFGILSGILVMGTGLMIIG